MTRILHTSDLHFTGSSQNQETQEELDYSCFVWESILHLAKKESVDAVLLSGDIFDRFSDIRDCRKIFLEKIPENSPPIFAISGNHEYLGKPNTESLSQFSLEPIHWVHIDHKNQTAGFQILDFENWELALIPYNPNGYSYWDWEVTQKRKPRILMAHGMVPEAMVYTGPSEEEGDHILELDFIRRFEPDYVALGHIHKNLSFADGKIQLHYSGSPRIWRKGEKGIRQVNLIQISQQNQIQVTIRPLREVGINQELSIQVLPSGEIPTRPIIDLLGGGDHCPKDCIYINLQGFSDSEKTINSEIQKIESQFRSNFRRMNWNRAGLDYMEGISELTFVKNFLQKWEEKYQNSQSEEDRKILEEARQIGLSNISKQYRTVRSV